MGILDAVKNAVTGKPEIVRPSYTDSSSSRGDGGEHKTVSHEEECKRVFESKGKQEPWEKAQDLTRQAMESARTAQIKSCDAQKTYDNYTRAMEAAKAATDRQAQLESELEAARRAAHPGDLKGKEAELQRAKEEARRLGEERAKAQKEVDSVRMELERHQKLVGEVDVTPVQQRVSRLEDELEQLRQRKREAEGKNASFAEEMRRIEAARGGKLSDVERLQHLLAQQDKEIDETTKHLKELKDNRERISRELSEAKRAAEAAGQKLEYAQQHVADTTTALDKISMKESELLEKIQAARDEVAKIQREHDAREVELRKAQEHYESVKKTAGPSAQSVVRAREAAEAIDRDLKAIAARAREADARRAELEKQYKLQGERASQAEATAEQKMKAYEQKKTVAEQADAYKKDLWEKAKVAGNEGDADAASRLAHMERRHEHKVEGKAEHHSSTTTTSHKVQERTGTAGTAKEE